MSLNKVLLIGRLGNDPELKETSAGESVCNFSVATSEKWKDKDGVSHEKTQWHRVTVWKKLAEACSEYLSKGRLVYIEGSLSTKSWEENGITKYSTEIIASNVQFLEPKS